MARRTVAALQAQGEDERAADLLRTYLGGEPANGEAIGLLARLAFAADDAEGAARWLDHGSAFGLDRDPELLALRAQAALATGDQKAAEAAARRAFAVQRSNPAAVRTLALVLGERGDTRMAQALMSRFPREDRRMARR